MRHLKIRRRQCKGIEAKPQALSAVERNRLDNQVVGT